MSVVDKILNAVTPEESSEDMAGVRSAARSLSSPGDWLSQILDHHIDLENAFAAAKAATGRDMRLAAQRTLAVILVGHATAEESVIYPAMSLAGESGHASTGYDEQATVKIEMAKLEALDPDSPRHQEQLENIRASVAHHMYEEEGTWFPFLKKNATPATQSKLSQRYEEEFQRYVGEI